MIHTQRGVGYSLRRPRPATRRHRDEDLAAAPAPGPARPLRRAQLRTRVLAGVLAVTLAALVAFDVAAVTALRGYLLSRADAQLPANPEPVPRPPV